MHSNTTRRTQSRARGAEQGFTILETVIALFVALVVGFGAISLFLFAANFNSGATDRARALALAQQMIEQQRAKPFDGLALGNTTESVNLGSAAAGVSDRRTFIVNTRIQNDPGVGGNKQKIVTVSVTPASAGRWTGGAVVLRMLRATDVVGSL